MTTAQATQRTHLTALLALLALGGCQSLLNVTQPVGLCGDGVVQQEAGEECDDGNTSSGDGCSDSCQQERCGNGIVDLLAGGGKEACDRGELNDDGGDCTTKCTPAVCGDKFLKTRGTPPFEVCDDGNTTNGDGCNPDCTLRGRVTVYDGKPGGMGVADGWGSDARFGGIWGLASDDEYVYISDQGACAIRRMEIATGTVETIAGQPGLCVASGDGPGPQAYFTGNPLSLARVQQALYVGEASVLRRVDLSDSDGQFTVATCAKLADANATIVALAGDPADTSVLYVATDVGVYTVALPCECDLLATSNKCSFKLLAGGTPATKMVDGVGAAARFVTPSALAVDSTTSTVYVADGMYLRTLDPTTAQVTTVAGSQLGHEDGVGSGAQFYALPALAHATQDNTSYVYAVEETYAYEKIDGAIVGSRRGWGNVRKIETQSWEVSTIAGTFGLFGGMAPEVDGFGPYVRFVRPHAATISRGILYVGQDASLRALSLEPPYPVTTAAGVLIRDFTHFDLSAVQAVDGTLYLSSFAGDLRELPVAQAGPMRNLGLCSTTMGVTHMIEAITAAGSVLYVLDRGMQGICRVDLAGKLGQPCCSGCKETCTKVFFAEGGASSPFLQWSPRDLAYDGTYLYFPDTWNQNILRVKPVEQPPYPAPEKLVKGSTSLLVSPWGITYLEPYLYVTSPDAHAVLRIDPKTGVVQAIGDGQARTVDGQGKKASFCRPTAIEGLASADGTIKRLFVGEAFCDLSSTEWNGHAVRQIDVGTDIDTVSTLVGPSGESAVVEGAGRRGSVNWPAAISFDEATGALYVADMWDNVLVKID